MISSTVQPIASASSRGRGGAAQLLGQLGGRRADLHAQLLQAARDPDGPALVAEVALDLADDRRGRVRRELDAAVGLEAVDGLDQADGAHLHEVLVRLAAVAEAPGAVLDQRQVQVHQVVAGGGAGRVRAVVVAHLAEELRAALAGHLDARGGTDASSVRRRPPVRGVPLHRAVPRDVVAHLRARRPPTRRSPPWRPPGSTSGTAPRTRSRSTSRRPRRPACRAPARRSCRSPAPGRRPPRSRPRRSMVPLPRWNRQVRSAPGSASGSTSARASPTAMRSSSMSSMVKSRRAARPAVVVRSTEA